MKTLNINTIAKYLFITFIALLGLICLIEGIITNNQFLLNS